MPPVAPPSSASAPSSTACCVAISCCRTDRGATPSSTRSSTSSGPRYATTCGSGCNDDGGCRRPAHRRLSSGGAEVPHRPSRLDGGDSCATQRAGALIAGQYRVEPLAAVRVGEDHGRSFGGQEPQLRPLQVGHQNSEECPPLLGEPVAA